MILQNLTDTRYRQAQFFFESRLRDEPEPVADVHFTSDYPFTVLGGLDFSSEGVDVITPPIFTRPQVMVSSL